MSSDEVKCPKCGSTQISADKKGFGLAKAVGGGVLLGPVGLLGGFVGSKKVMVTCLKCGHQWKAGKA
jgi:tellurium resistance protein TerD